MGCTFWLLGSLGAPRRLGPPKAQVIVFINTLVRNAHFRLCWPPGPLLASAARGPSLEADLHICAQARCLRTLMLLYVILCYLYVYLGGHRILQKPIRTRFCVFCANVDFCYFMLLVYKSGMRSLRGCLSAQAALQSSPESPREPPGSPRVSPGNSPRGTSGSHRAPQGLGSLASTRVTAGHGL